MKVHDPHVLDYQAPRQRERWRFSIVTWVVPITSGLAAGWVLDNCGNGWQCFAVSIGFGVATLSAAFAPGRRLAFGLLGNGCTMVAWLSSWAIEDWRRGKPVSVDLSPALALFLAAVVSLPGLLGIGLVCAMDSAGRPRTPFD